MSQTNVAFGSVGVRQKTTTVAATSAPYAAIERQYFVIHFWTMYPALKTISPRPTCGGPTMKKPKVPKNTIIEKASHTDTLHHCEYVLDMLADLAGVEDDSLNAKSGRFWVNRMISDSLRYVSDSLQYEALEKKKTDDDM